MLTVLYVPYKRSLLFRSHSNQPSSTKIKILGERTRFDKSSRSGAALNGGTTLNLMRALCSIILRRSIELLGSSFDTLLPACFTSFVSHSPVFFSSYRSHRLPAHSASTMPVSTCLSLLFLGQVSVQTKLKGKLILTDCIPSLHVAMYIVILRSSALHTGGSERSCLLQDMFVPSQ